MPLNCSLKLKSADYSGSPVVLRSVSLSPNCHYFTLCVSCSTTRSSHDTVYINPHGHMMHGVGNHPVVFVSVFVIFRKCMKKLSEFGKPGWRHVFSKRQQPLVRAVLPVLTDSVFNRTLLLLLILPQEHYERVLCSRRLDPNVNDGENSSYILIIQ